jgi:hypothetical protein
MKRTIIILLLFIIPSILFAGKSSLKEIPKIKLNNSSGFSLSKITDINCDLCACYLGIDPHYNMNTFGIRFRHRGYINEPAPGNDAINSTDAAGNEPPSVFHEGHSHSGKKESYNTFEIWGRYYINPKIQVLFSIPFSRNEIDNGNISGFGDAYVITQYQIFNTDVDGDTKFRNRLFMGGGLKFPTGKYNQTTGTGSFEPHFQTGTGSIDFILNSTYLATYNQAGLSTDVSYRINTRNSNDYKFADRLNINSSFFYKIRSDNMTFLPNAGIYLEQAEKDHSKNSVDENSGGSVLFATFGIDFYLKGFSLNFNFQKPVSENLNGVQPKNDKRIVAGFGYSFDL